MSTLPTGPVRVTYRLTGMVNGKRRSVVTTGPRGLDAREAEITLLENDHETYKRFYRGATPEDYEAGIVDLVVEVHDWRELE